jgi:1-acyl-sn-glycerol-3-phosphate acyltransferase
MLSVAPVSIDFIAKIELYDIPVLGALLEAYGVIWVHRGRPDRRALHAALNGLAEGRLVAVAPEGRESLSGSLEEGTGGAAYIALKADVPILPVTFTGTENLRVYGNLKRFRRTEITATVGRTFRLERGKYLREAVQEGTQRIMRKLALQLPKGYRGVYQGAPEDR